MDCNTNNCKTEKIDGIKCNVVNCTYHTDGCACNAGCIEVGPTAAKTSSDTVCTTFKPKH